MTTSPTPMRSAESWAAEILGNEEYSGDIALARLMERALADARRAAVEECAAVCEAAEDTLLSMASACLYEDLAQHHIAAATGCGKCHGRVLALLPATTDTATDDERAKGKT